VEHSIHMAHLASVSIDTHLLFSDVYIETSAHRAHSVPGHRKRDAIRMKQLIEQYQTPTTSGRPQPPPACAGAPRSVVPAPFT